MRKGAIIGIVIAVVVVLILIAVGIWFFFFRKKSNGGKWSCKAAQQGKQRLYNKNNLTVDTTADPFGKIKTCSNILDLKTLQVTVAGGKTATVTIQGCTHVPINSVEGAIMSTAPKLSTPDKDWKKWGALISSATGTGVSALSCANKSKPALNFGASWTGPPKDLLAAAGIGLSLVTSDGTTQYLIVGITNIPKPLPNGNVTWNTNGVGPK